MIVGICGKAGSGKDTTADILVKDHGFVKVAFSDPLKRICRDIFDFSYEQLWGPSEKRNEPDRRYSRLVPKIDGTLAELIETVQPMKNEWYLTPRFALQQLGTEWGRNCYPDIWVEYALRVADKILKRNYLINEPIWRYDAERGLYRSNEGFIPTQSFTASGYQLPTGVVISDVRFLNEVDALRKRPDISIWRVTRASAGLTGAAALHQSEVELESIPAEKFTHMIENNSSLDDLVKTVKEVLQRKDNHL